MFRSMRMIGVFGWRESELAALRILDSQWETPFARVDVTSLTSDERLGYDQLRSLGWIDASGSPTRSFWLRVHGR